MKKGMLFVWIALALSNTNLHAQRVVESFNDHWKFKLGQDSLAMQENYNDASWRKLDLPHDWSIELPFDQNSAATTLGGALSGGIGWYRKQFSIPESDRNKKIFIEFDGIYRNSEVYINGHLLGRRPNGYISFRYELSNYLHVGTTPNLIAVKVDHSGQPNSRWYTGSGIYRNTRMVKLNNRIAIDEEGSFVTTPKITATKATVHLSLTLAHYNGKQEKIKVVSKIYDPSQKFVGGAINYEEVTKEQQEIAQDFKIDQPKLWSVDHPVLYQVKTTIYADNKIIDTYQTPLGIRYFHFDSNKGFFFNGQPMKIKGVCLHHDQGALGTAVNTAAIRRQLRILKEMGCNAIRTSHNPPARELLDLCDEMGFLVMDEAFDMWKKKKNKFDYALDFNEWHQRDLQDQIRRDRNHPSVFMWSIGNEIREQFDSTGITIGKELVAIIKKMDTSRPVTCALSEADPKKNFIYQSGALDVVGLNYHIETYADFLKNYPGQKFLGTENMSALASRGDYDMPSDSMRYWPESSKFKTVNKGNADFTVSAYDHVAAYWGTSHEESWKKIKQYDFLSGTFVWSGFDYLGEPTPYPWPARSAYFGIVDLAGFPKDVYYMYQSEWTRKPMLHLFPHWNWTPGKIVDIWAYYNNADEVELFLNGKSLGIKRKKGDDMHVMWRVPFVPGKLKLVSRQNGKIVMVKEEATAGNPYRIELEADRKIIHSDGGDLCYVTVKLLDQNGQLVPNADQLINFSLTGNATIAAVDNGFQADLTSFQSHTRKTYHGLCMVAIRASKIGETAKLIAQSQGLVSGQISIVIK